MLNPPLGTLSKRPGSRSLPQARSHPLAAGETYHSPFRRAPRGLAMRRCRVGLRAGRRAGRHSPGMCRAHPLPPHTNVHGERPWGKDNAVPHMSAGEPAQSLLLPSVRMKPSPTHESNRFRSYQKENRRRSALPPMTATDAGWPASFCEPPTSTSPLSSTLSKVPPKRTSFSKQRAGVIKERQQRHQLGAFSHAQ